MTRVVIFSGGGDYTDPWHPFVETSGVVAEVLREDDFEVIVVYEINDLKKTLRNSDVLVVNAGGGQHAHAKDGALETVLAAHRGGILALHVAATLLPDSGFWEGRLGGRWVRGHTMHPARGAMRLVRAGHAGSDLPAFIDTVDEAYSWLRVDEGSRILFRHEHDGEMHAVVWTFETPVARSAYCALGHDVEAYGPPEVRELIIHLARWVGANTL